MRPLNVILQDIQQCEGTNRREQIKLLRELMPQRLSHFQASIENNLCEEYADALLKILLLEMEEEEEESIEMAELTYLSISNILQNTPSPELLKKRILLLHYFYEYFIDTIIEIFLQDYRDTNLLQARSLAIESIEKMRLIDIIQLEEHFKSFLDKDEQLGDVCNAIEITPYWSEELDNEAKTLHRVLEAYLRIKYQKDCPIKTT